jgi:hypothetical protein
VNANLLFLYVGITLTIDGTIVKTNNIYNIYMVNVRHNTLITVIFQL